jgi:hypothetical protein
LTVYSTVSTHHARLGAVASLVRRRLLGLGLAVRAAAFRAEMPGFFALAAEAPTLRATCRHLTVKERSRAPCAHRLGERTERQCRGRVLSLLGAARQSPHCRASPRSLGLAPCGAGLALPPDRDPTRLPRIQSMVGDQPPRLDHRPAIRRRHHRGPASVFRPPRAVAPLREVNDDLPRPGLSPSCRLATRSSWGVPRSLLRDPLRRSASLNVPEYASLGLPGLGPLATAAQHPHWPHGLPWTHRRDASNPLLQPTFRVTSTRSEKHHLWRLPAERRG